MCVATGMVIKVSWLGLPQRSMPSSAGIQGLGDIGISCLLSAHNTMKIHTGEESFSPLTITTVFIHECKGKLTNPEKESNYSDWKEKKDINFKET